MEKPDKCFLKQLDVCRKQMYASGRIGTLRELLERSKKYYGGRIQFAEKVNKETVCYSVDTFYDDVRAVGQALLSRGLKNEHIAIVGENSYSWIVAFFAATCSGNAAVPIDKELSDEAIARLAEKADCGAIFFSAAYEGAARLFAGSEKLAVCMKGTAKMNDCPTLSSLKEESRSEDGSCGGFDSVRPLDSDAAAIVFTSGTTGENKGVILSHENLCSNFQNLAVLIKPISTAMSVLPMNHIYELSCIVFTAVYMNALLYINDSLRHFESNLREFHPEAMAAVPMLLDSVYDGIVSAAQKSGKLDSLKKGIRINKFLLKFGIDIRRYLFKDVLKRFGYKFPAISCGGAPVDSEKAAFLQDIGFDIYIGYGLTETSPIVTLNTEVDKNPNSVGKCLADCEIRIVSPDADGDGEIAVKGRNVTKGYYKDGQATERSFSDGWFLTGDYGSLGKNGELYISGRKKNIIILDNGKNIYTEAVEHYFTEKSQYIKEAVIFEAEKDTPSGKVRYLAMGASVSPEDFAGKTGAEIEKTVSDEVARLNAELPPFEHVSDVMTVTRGFNKTSTLKIIRKDVEKEYAEKLPERMKEYG